jgi:neutral trehalase
MKNFYILPRKNSTRSAPMFNRLISKENFTFLEDTSITLSDKAYRIQTLGNFMGQLGTYYNDKIRAQQYYGDELVEIYAIHLFVRGKMLELAENINNSTRQEDIAMQSGRNGIVGSYVFLLTFLVSEEKKPEAFSSGQLKRLNKEMAHSLSNNIKYLDSLSKQKLSAEIRKLYEINKSGSGRKEVDEMLKFLSE